MTTEKTPEERIDALEEAVINMLDMLEDMAKKLATVEKTAVTKPKGLFGGKRSKTAIEDTKTGTVYPSKSAVGKALYGEIKDGDPSDRFIWYKLLTQFPERFKELGEDDPKAVKVWADEKAKVEAEVEAANKKLAAEQAAKDAAEAAKTTPPAAPPAPPAGKGK